MISASVQMKKKKKLFLIFHGRFPSNKAASLFAAKSAEAFAGEGLTVEMIVSRRLGREKGDPYDYYNVKNVFRLVYLPVLDIPSKSRMTSIRFALSSFSFSLFCYLYLLKHAKREDIIYSNEPPPLFFASLSFPRTFYEMHDFPESGLGLFGVFIRRMESVLIHNTWKADEARRIFSLHEKRILREPNAVQIEDFDIATTREEAREKLSLPQDKKIAVYTGHLYSWKGVDTLALAARELPGEYLVIFIGGTPEDIKKLRDANNTAGNTLFVGWKSHSEIPLWQKAADVLILPNTAKEDISKYYTSPMKLFEYMVSRVPIVASRIPSIEEIVTDEDVFFAEADNATSFAETIQKAVESTLDAQNRAAHAYTKILQFTWSKRAKRILSFMNHSGIKSSGVHKARIFFLARYLFSGGLSFTTNMLLLFVLKEYFNMWYLTASTIAFVISVVVSFLAQKFITFRDKSKDRISKQLPLYMVVALFNVIMNGVMMFTFVSMLYVPYLLAQVFSAGLIAVWSLLVYRYIIFSNVKIS